MKPWWTTCGAVEAMTAGRSDALAVDLQEHAEAGRELQREGHTVSHMTVARLISDMGYSLQANRKTLEGADNPDRDAQFRHISKQVMAFQKQGQPVISVDAKKRELVGNF